MNGFKLLGLVMVLVAGLFHAVKASETNAELHQLFAKEWQARLDRMPMLATQMGLTRSNHLLLDASEKAYQAWGKQTTEFLIQLTAIDYQQLSNADQINYQIFKQQLEQRIAEIQFKSYQIPFLSDSGFHTGIMRLSTQIPLKNLQDYQNYLARLAAVPEYFEQNMANMRAGLKRNFSMPKIVMEGFSEVIKATFEQGWEKSSFWQDFEKMPSTIAQKDQITLRKNAEKVIRYKLIPAFKRLHEFFETEYIPQTKTSLAAYDFPDGKSYYQAQIREYTTLDLTPESIHQVGLSEVARIRGEMEQIIADLKYSGDFKSFLTMLRESPHFYAKTPLELIKEASYIAKKMDGQLPKLFTRLPRQPYTVEPVPEAIAPKYTTGRYVSAPLDSERPGTYWVNTYALDKRPLYVLEALTLHEAVPGHHLQNALNQELDNLPNFRRYSYISAFGEGWGLYSERLGLEVGFYQDPYSNFGRLTYEMWRAARLVIDTGIHAMGWTREQAIALLEDNSALSTHNIRTEVDRYISWPGQALSYKLGEIKIWELREKAQKQLGEKFDIRHFHDAVLENGSIPLGLLEQQIDRYIADTLAK
jgi:uncharacterized protein (DUF885 family)